MEIPAQTTSSNPKVVIIGGGFGGIYAARILANQPVDVTLIDRTNTTCFSPCYTKWRPQCFPPRTSHNQ